MSSACQAIIKTPTEGVADQQRGLVVTRPVHVTPGGACLQTVHSQDSVTANKMLREETVIGADQALLVWGWMILKAA